MDQIAAHLGGFVCSAGSMVGVINPGCSGPVGRLTIGYLACIVACCSFSACFFARNRV